MKKKTTRTTTYPIKEENIHYSNTNEVHCPKCENKLIIAHGDPWGEYASMYYFCEHCKIPTDPKEWREKLKGVL